MSLPDSQATPLILFDHLFNIGLTGLLLIAFWSVGLRLLGLLGCADMPSLPKALLSLSLGLGCVAYTLFGLGLLGLFQRPILAGVVAALLVVASREVARPRVAWQAALQKGWRTFARTPAPDRLLLVIGSGGFLVALALALAPPTDYDGLMYHLAVPAKFLEAGRIYPMPEMVQANFPFTAEMIYSLGLAVGSESFGRLTNLALWMLLVAGTWWTGNRYLGGRTGLQAALVLLTAPAAYLASSTCVEMIWAALMLSGILAFLRYVEQDNLRLVALMGIISGLVLGTKEVAIASPAFLACGIGVHDLLRRRLGLVETARRLILFSAITVLVASPWYLKNWLWLGSPLFPLFTEAEEWTSYYLTTAGAPKTLVGLITLPLAIFFTPDGWVFSAAMPSFFFLSYLFLGLPAIFLTARNRYTYYLLLFAALFFAVWAAGYQLVRFLFPAFPIFSLLVAHGLTEGRCRHHRLPAGIRRVLLATFLGLSLSLHLILLNAINPLGVLTGLESRTGFLAQPLAVQIYSATRWANDHLPKDSRLYMIGAGQGYYFQHDALLDSTTANLDRMFAGESDAAKALSSLREAGYTHLFYSKADMNWHLSHRDPAGRLRRLATLLQDQLEKHAALLYEDDAVMIYQLD